MKTTRTCRRDISALLLTVAAVIAATLLMFCPASAHAQSGVPLWTNRYDGPGNGYDGPTAIAVDSSGNVFVTGSSRNGSSWDYATIAYSNTGVPLWTNRYDGPGSGWDGATAIAVDSSGLVIVTGYSANYPSFPIDWDYATIKYSNTGVPLWTNRYNGPGNDNDAARAIALDSSGNVFVTGQSRSGSDDLTADYATVAYSSASEVLWVNRYNGPLNSWDSAYAIAVDPSGNVFVTGQSAASADSLGTIPDYATVAYSSVGVPLWTNRYNGPANGGDSASSLAVDRSGNVFVTGASDPGSATIAYSSAGVSVWTNRFDGGLSKIVVDRSGNVFVTGSSWNGTTDDYVTIKYSSSIPPPRLNFRLLSNQLVLTWTNAGFNLQSASAVTGTFTNLPGATSPYTNALTGPQVFFRLKGDGP